MNNKLRKLGAKLKSLTSKQILPALAVVLVVGAIGAYQLRKSSAAPSYATIFGKVTDQKGNVVPGVGVYECQNNKSVLTNASGLYGFTVVTNTSGDSVGIPEFCLRPSSLPANYSNMVATNEPNGASTYEHQVAGLNCYHNYANCGPTKPYRTSSYALDWDVSINDDSKYNFRVTYNDSVKPSTPSINGSAASTSQINLSWSTSTDNYSGITAYYLYRNGSLRATVGSTGYQDTGLTAGTIYSYYVKAKDGAGNYSSSSNTISIKTISNSSPSPSPNPSPSPSPNPSPNSPPPKPTGGDPNATTKPGTPDKTPPTVPGNFKAAPNESTKTIQLSWDASKDNVGVKGYSVERSTDNQNWISLNNNVQTNYYEDQDVSFGQDYYYRVVAFDAANNVSDYATTHVISSDFTTNTFQNQDSSITSEDKIVTVNIPSGALSQDAFCVVDGANDVLPPNISGYTDVAGPYEINCRDSSGTVINNFNKEMSISISYGSLSTAKISGFDYFGQAAEASWQKLKITKHDKKNKVDEANLQNFTVFSILGKNKKTPIIITILEFLFVVGALVFIARFVVRILIRRRAEDDYDSYIKKSKGL